jgi:hypothetical protein
MASLQCAERLLGDKAARVTHFRTRNRYSGKTAGSQQCQGSADSRKERIPWHTPWSRATDYGAGDRGDTYRENGESHSLAVAWGFAEVLPDRVTILAETAEHAGEIDERRAEQAKKRAEQRLTSSDPSVDCPCAACTRACHHSTAHSRAATDSKKRKQATVNSECGWH